MAGSTTSEHVHTNEWVDHFVDRWVAALNSHDVDRVLELMTDDIVYEDSSWPRSMRGHADVREFLAWSWTAFPDITQERIGPVHVAADAKNAAYWFHGKGTNTGPVDPPGLPATGKPVHFEGGEFQEYRDGKLARLRMVFDMADLSRQLGR